MSTALMTHEENDIVADIEQTQKVCTALMRTPHYAKLGEVGIFAIVQKAKSVGMSPLDALNGGMYFVQGKVEMQGVAMLALIRSKGHSVSLDPQSTDSKVIMHGRRCDTQDTWRAEFSVEDAKKQGIYRNQWEKMPKIMCQWRCVSQLGRFLFSDILKGVYVEGEIRDAVPFDAVVDYNKVIEIENPIPKEDSDELAAIVEQCSNAYQEVVKKFLKKYNAKTFQDLPLDTFNKMKDAAIKKREEYIKECDLQKEEEEEPKLTYAEMKQQVDE